MITPLCWSVDGGSHDSAIEEEVDEDPENILGEPLGTVAMTNNYCDKKFYKSYHLQQVLYWSTQSMDQGQLYMQQLEIDRYKLDEEWTK